MPFSRLISNLRKIITHTFIRPVQRYNVYNRAKKYLGPDSKYFEPAPRAIGIMSDRGKKPIKYPHLTDQMFGFKSVQQKRLEAIEKTKLLSNSVDKDANLKSELEDPIKDKDKFIVQSSSRLEVKKTILDVPNNQYLPSTGISKQNKQIESNSSQLDENKNHRPLPTMTSLQLNDPASIWFVEKTPPGRLNLDQLQELMLNKLSDGDNYWTPEKIASTYKIKEEYAKLLCDHLKHIVIHISPRIAKVMEYTAKDNKIYQASKDTVYIVNNNLRSDEDKMFDKTFLPTDNLDSEVKGVIGDIKLEEEETVDVLVSNFNTLARKIEPLRLGPLNRPNNGPKTISESIDTIKHLEADRKKPLLEQNGVLPATKPLPTKKSSSNDI